MLDRAVATEVPETMLRIPVADAEAIIGLKVQAIANNPARRDRDRDDIVQRSSMKHARSDDPTVGRMFDGPIADQRIVRPDEPMRNLKQFLDFLDELEAIFGPTIRPSQPILGDRFLL